MLSTGEHGSVGGGVVVVEAIQKDGDEHRAICLEQGANAGQVDIHTRGAGSMVLAHQASVGINVHTIVLPRPVQE